MDESGLMRKTDLEPIVGKPVRVCLYEAVRACAEDIVIGIRLKHGLATLMYAEFSLGMNLLVDEDDTVVEVMRAIAEADGEAADRMVKDWIKEPQRVREYRPLVADFLAEVEAGNVQLADHEHPDSPDHPSNW